jgi:hypothetical protein
MNSPLGRRRGGGGGGGGGGGVGCGGCGAGRNPQELHVSRFGSMVFGPYESISRRGLVPRRVELGALSCDFCFWISCDTAGSQIDLGLTSACLSLMSV